MSAARSEDQLLDELRSARARREQYVGAWLPKPILTDSRDDPARHAEMAGPAVAGHEQRAVLLPRDCSTTAMTRALAHDVSLTGDGGGKIAALAHPLLGRIRVAGALINWIRTGRGSQAPAGAGRAKGADVDLQQRRVAAARRALSDRACRLQPPPTGVIAGRRAAAIGRRVTTAGRPA